MLFSVFCMVAVRPGDSNLIVRLGSPGIRAAEASVINFHFCNTSDCHSGQSEEEAGATAAASRRCLTWPAERACLSGFTHQVRTHIKLTACSSNAEKRFGCIDRIIAVT